MPRPTAPGAHIHPTLVLVLGPPHPATTAATMSTPNATTRRGELLPFEEEGVGTAVAEGLVEEVEAIGMQEGMERGMGGGEEQDEE
jgi:hypothetical protein